MTMHESVTTEPRTQLRRYERPHEAAPDVVSRPAGPVILYADLPQALAESSLTPGSRAMLTGLLRLGNCALFPGGGAGIEYGSLLKTAVRPEHLCGHVQEASVHLHERGVDLLVVPGMSGYPVGAMYSIVSGIPALLLKKQKHSPDADLSAHYPPGTFVIPSYTGDGDVVMSADMVALQDIVNSIAESQLAAQVDDPSVKLHVRIAGADDIIDKATMSQAVSESALIATSAALDAFVARYRRRADDSRLIESGVEVVAWVTPLIKGYNRPHDHLNRWFGITPFAGLNVTSVHLDPPALGIDGIGIVAFAVADV